MRRLLKREELRAPFSAEQALSESHANLEALIENTDAFVLFSDCQGKPLYFNTAYARVMKNLLGIDMKPGIKPHELLPNPDQRALWDDHHRRVLSGEKFTIEFGYEHEGVRCP